jgi:glycosyltransferase involved in cell wall biosynthesis
VVLMAPYIQDYCIEFGNAITKKAKVTLIAPIRSFAGLSQFVDDAVDLRLVEWPRHRSLRNCLFLFHLIRMIDDLQPDIVHFLSEGVVWLGLAAPLFSRRYRIVTTMHDVEYHPGDHASRRVPRWFVDRLILRSDRLIVHGSSLKRAAERRYPTLKGRVEVVPHSILHRYCLIAEKNALRHKYSESINVLFFGRIYAYKGLDILIKSIPLIATQVDKVRVTIAGEGENIDSYIAMMTNPELFEVRNRHIDDEETAQLFIDADIVVLPYLEASQSGVLAIANAFGKAVIVTDVGELAHTVKNGVTGIVVAPGDERALADAIFRLATDAPLRARLGNAGRAEATKAASPELVAKVAMDIYKNVMGTLS